VENSLVANPVAKVAAFRGKIHDSILDTIGMTPLVCLHQTTEEVGQRTEMAGKIYSHNLAFSAELYLSTALFDGLSEGK
jgi:cysteine synthase A